MKSFFLFLLSCFFFTWSLQAQSVGVGTTTPDPSAALEVSSSTKGMLIPRMTAAQRAAIASPTIGLQVYQTDGTKGLYHFDGTSWQPISSSSGGWSTTGNAGINPATNFIGTTDTQPLIGKANNEQVFRFTPNSNNTTIGYMAHKSDYAGGTFNHVIGYKAGYNNAGSFGHFDGLNAGYNNYGNNNQFIGYNTGYTNTSGNANLFIGSAAGYSNTSGSQNHFIGYQAGYANTTPAGNQFDGHQSGFKNITGTQNQFAGFQSGYNNTSGHYNFFDGYKAGFNNVIGQNNYFSGYHAGYSNTTDNNHFVGYKAGYNTTTGRYNTFSGLLSGFSNDTGEKNHFEGYTAGYSNTIGNSNHFSGFSAGRNNTAGNNNHFDGFESGYQHLSGNNNTFLGFRSGYDHVGGNNNVFIGSQAGYHNLLGSYNVFIGPNAGINETGSHKLYIAGEDGIPPLIYGSFDNQYIMVNGSGSFIRTANSIEPVLSLSEGYQYYSKLRFLKANAPNGSWDIGAYIHPSNQSMSEMRWFANEQPTLANYGNGDLWVFGELSELSDSTQKENIRPIQSALAKILTITGFTYQWKNRSVKGNDEHIGFMAQDLEKVFPQLVNTDAKGEKSVSYTHMVPVLLEAIKEQQKEIDSLKEMMKDLIGKQ